MNIATQGRAACAAALWSIGVILQASSSSADEMGWFGSVEGSYLMEDGDRVKPVHEFDINSNGMSTNMEGPKALTASNGGGFRGNLGYDFGRWDVALGYAGSWLDDEQSFSAEGGPAFPISDIGFLTWQDDQVGFGTRFLNGHAKEEWERHVIDLKLGYDALYTTAGRVHFFGGLRIASLEHELKIDGYQAPGAYAAQMRNERLWGLGPMIGIDGTLTLNPEFSLTGGITTAVLFGHKRNRFEGDYTSPVLGSRFHSEGENRNGKTIYNTTAEAGLSYTPQMPGGTDFTVTLGYRLDQWWNVHDTRSSAYSLNGGLQYEGEVGSKHADTTSHGPFLRLGVRF